MKVERGWIALLALLLALLTPATAVAADELVEAATGVRFRVLREVAGVEYECLGAGLRKLLFFKVYAIAFCLDSAQARRALDRAGDASAPREFFGRLSRSEADKLAILELVRDVPAQRMAGAFRDSLARILPPGKIEKLIATIPGDAEAGQSVLLYSRGSRLIIDIAGERKQVDDAEISSKLWQVWLGPESITPGLKHSIAERLGAARAGVDKRHRLPR